MTIQRMGDMHLSIGLSCGEVDIIHSQLECVIHRRQLLLVQHGRLLHIKYYNNYQLVPHFLHHHILHHLHL